MSLSQLSHAASRLGAGVSELGAGASRLIGRLPGGGGVRRSVAALRSDRPASVRGDAGGLGAVPQEAIGLAASVAGLSLALAGRTIRVRPLPVVVPTVLSWADVSPRVREALVQRFGRPATELAFGLGTASTQALSQRPFGLLIDGVHRLSRLTEAQARRRAWERGGADLGADDDAEPVVPAPRPAALPTGPIERYADAATAAALAAFLTALVTSRSRQRALAMLVAGLPKAAHVGRDAYAAQLGRTAARRGALITDPEALRRLDRVDTVVLDASAVLTGEHAIDGVVGLDAGVSLPELRRHAHELVDLTHPEAMRRRGRWAVVPRPDQPPPVHVRAWARAATRRGARVLTLTRDGTPVAAVSVIQVLDPLADALVAAAQGAGRVLIAGSGSRLVERLPVDGAVPGRARLVRSVRALQEAGHGVVLVTGRGSAALAAADVGIGVIGREVRPPWGAHVLCGPALACLLLNAVAAARLVSRRSVQVAATASAAGGLVATVGPARGAAARAALAPQAGAGITLAVGTWSGLQLARTPTPVPADRTPWHAMPANTVLDRLATTSEGLDEQEAQRRAQQAPPAAASEPEGLARASLEELANPLTPALAAAAGLSAALGSLLDAVMIGGVLGVNAVIGGAQKIGANRALRRLGAASATMVRLRRDRHTVTTTADRLVPGDVIELTAGDIVPADCRILEADALEMDESSLTGESQLAFKTPQPTAAAAIGDRRSMLYAGTVVAAGRTAAVIVATGDHTEVGRTAQLATDPPHATGVEDRLRALTRVTLPMSIAAGGALMALDLLRGRTVGQALGPGVSLAVAAIPEGLPFVATVAELAAAHRLSRRGALVRNPPTIETLGRVNALCFDKTGTLTEGRIRLRGVSNGVTYEPIEEPSPALRRVVAAGLRASPSAEAGPMPHPTDRAVIKGGRSLAVTPTHGEPSWEPVEEEPFEPGRGYHAVIGQSTRGRLLSVKGAPEVVLDECTTWWREDSLVPFDADAQRRVGAEVDRLARRGYRLLAVAERPIDPHATLDDTGIRELELLGLLALADQPRATAAAAVEQLQQAGVDIIMLTGDHPSTAEAIAAELNVLNGRQVVTGPELDAMDDRTLAAVLPGTAVFARVSPHQKVRIVNGLRSLGRIVAVTGDGANDAPAIRLADVGVALGRRATPAAREAADVVVVDDRLETITQAIVEGRMMWASVRDALSILLGGNLGEIVFTIGGGLLGGADVLNARQLLLVNLLTDMLPALAVAVRRPPGITPEALLAEGPEASLGGALTRDVYLRAAVTAAAATAAWLLARITGPRSKGSTVALVGLVAAQLGQTIAVDRRSWLVFGSVLASLVALVVIVQTPVLSQLFGCRPLGPRGWTIGLGAALGGTAAAVVLPRVLPSRAQ